MRAALKFSVGGWVHRLVSLASLGWALYCFVDVIARRHEIHPYTALGWSREHALFALSIAVVGAWGAVARAPSEAARRRSMTILAALALFGFARSLDATIGLLAMTALATRLLLATRWIERLACVAVLVPIAAWWWTSRAPARVVAPPAPSSATAAPSSAPDPATPFCALAEEQLASWAATDSEAAALRQSLEVSKLLSHAALEPVYCRLVLDNLRDKAALRARGLAFSAVEIEQHVLEFERFRLGATLSAGVTPKRYFGFFDEQGDTAPYERALRETVERAVAIVNAEAARRGSAVRVTELDVAVTFLAEGGALILTERQEELESIHPVNGIGLDSVRDGFAAYPELVRALDAELGTRLQDLVWSAGKLRVLHRRMSFREAIAGTALMFLYEKERTARLLAARDANARLETMPLERQFVVTSLVYNSGILFDEARVDQILGFATADYLVQINLANLGKRAPLEVLSAQEREARLVAGEALPRQLTSWSAVYHVLQRYGAWVALRAFSDLFDGEGRFRRRS